VEIEIREAEESDIAVLYGLIGVLGFHKEPGYFERCLAEQAAQTRKIFIAAANNSNAGYGMLNWQPQYALYQRLGIPEIQDLNVIPAARRRGIATALIAHCEGVARQRDCSQIGISVGLTASYGAAQVLYTKLGYRPDGNGISYDRIPVDFGEVRPVDNDLCLMMIRDL
jgi:GNAT superfamily N-acetyltransferase